MSESGQNIDGFAMNVKFLGGSGRGAGVEALDLETAFESSTYPNLGLDKSNRLPTHHLRKLPPRTHPGTRTKARPKRPLQVPSPR